MTMAQLETISIRKAVPNDLQQMLRIMDEVLETPTIDDEMDQRIENWLRKLNDNSQFIFYVAESDHGNLIGWCRGGKTVAPHRVVAQQEYDCEVQNIFIRKAYQHRGIGRELWKIIWNDVLVSFQPKNFVVWSVDKEQAQKFYSSLGGVEKEKRKFDGDCFLTAFVWQDINLYQSTNFILFK
jgi:ribosomal protein S18 acetylase RimI-like enzyme